MFEDEKAEVLMELSDLIFEDLVDDFVNEIHEPLESKQWFNINNIFFYK